MRVKLSPSNLALLFHGISATFIAEKFHVSSRNVRDWRSAKLTMPKDVYSFLVKYKKLSNVELEPLFLSDEWHRQNASRKGALARMAKYGSLGTPEGRRKGGLASARSHKVLKTKFKQLHKIRTDLSKTELAELLGVFFGDGHLAKYQASISTSSVTDVKHAKHVQSLMQKHFGLPVSINKKSSCNAIEVIVSSRLAVEHLHSLGMPKGNKINAGLAVPVWIKKDLELQKAFLRGLFDTDGCVYADRHVAKGKTYIYTSIAITTYSRELMTDLLKMLKALHFSPSWVKSQKSAFLRRESDVKKFFDEVGTNNPKHKDRYIRFGGVPKWS